MTSSTKLELHDNSITEEDRSWPQAAFTKNVVVWASGVWDMQTDMQIDTPTVGLANYNTLHAYQQMK